MFRGLIVWTLLGIAALMLLFMVFTTVLSFVFALLPYAIILAAVIGAVILAVRLRRSRQTSK